jgi:hypothetical protein
MEVYSNYKEKLLLGSRACFLRNKTSMLITMAKKWGRLYYTVTKQYPLHYVSESSHRSCGQPVVYPQVC